MFIVVVVFIVSDYEDERIFSENSLFESVYYCQNGQYLQTYIKQLLDEVFVIFVTIKIEISRLILRNQPSLPKFGRCQQYTINWYICLKTSFIDGILAWKRGCLGNRPSINLASRRGRQAVYSKKGVHGFSKTK